MDAVAQYVNRVLAILREKQTTADQIAQLDKLSETLGLTRDDLAYIEQQFEAGRLRGLGYARHQQTDKAIAEWEACLLLKPLHAPIIADLATAYAQAYRQSRQEADRLKALEYAERVLQLEPQREATLSLIAELQKTKGWTSRKRLLWASAAVVALLACLYGVYIFFGLILFKEQIKEQSDYVPVELDASLLRAGVRLEVESSASPAEGTGFAYQLRAELHHPKRHLQHLVLDLEAYDTAGKLLANQPVTLVGEEDCEIETEHRLPLAQTLRLVRRAAKVRLVGKQYEDSEAHMPVHKSPVVRSEGENPPRIWESYQTIKPTATDFKHTLCLAYQHTLKNVHTLRAEIQWYDKQHRLVYAQTISLVEAQEPMLRAGKRRAKTLHFQIPLAYKDYSHYEVLILRVE